MAEAVDLGPTGGAVWADPDEWEHRKTPEGCIICQAGRPLDVIAETPSCWINAPIDAPLPGYACVVAKGHVNEPFEMSPADQAAFWMGSMAVARAISSVVRPVKMNYEIHGNTLPHLHLHLFPRQLDDPYVGGPIDPRRASFHRSEVDLDRLRVAILSALEPDSASSFGSSTS